MATTSDLCDVCRLLGGVALEGARPDLLREIQKTRAAEELGTAMGGGLGEALGSMQRALDSEAPEALAIEYTRLMVANAAHGARSPLPVPPWEDCYTGQGRAVMGEKSRSALRAYAAAFLGYDGMKGRPADHVGLEIWFVAALLDEEEQGKRDAAVRVAFVEEHIKGFAPAFGRKLSEEARSAFWRETGRAIAQLPGPLSGVIPSTAGGQS